MTEITEYQNGSDTTIISFSGIGNQNYIAEEFFNITKLNSNVIFVKDENRTWFNNVEVDKIIDCIKTNKVYCIGNSMGAFNATIFSTEYPVTKVLGFCTQYSVHPDIVPWESRWNNYVKKISNWKYKNLNFSNSTEYLFLSGNLKRDKKHINLIPDHKNIKKIILEGDHNLALQLKKDGKLYDIVESFFFKNKISMHLR